MNLPPELGLGGQQQNIPQVGPYNPLIGGDWEVQALEADMGAQIERARGGFRQQIRQALIDLGITDLSKLGGLGSWIDSETIKKAAQNKYSQTAQIAEREKTQKAVGEASLASRGLLSSGQTTTEAERRVAEAESGRFNALRTFLSTGEQGLGGLADLEADLNRQLAMARFNAAQRAADTYGYLGANEAPGTSPVPRPARPTRPSLLQQMINRGRIRYRDVANLGLKRPPARRAPARPRQPARGRRR